MNLQHNVFNRRRSPDQTKFKIWSSAGLMLTYSCPAQCACCYVFSGPHAGSTATEMSVAFALDCWRDIRRLAGNRGKVHLTGGEPFLDYPRLKNILQSACEQQLAGLEKIETNACWCTHESLVRDRLMELKHLGLTKLQISTDIYHQQYIPIENVRLAQSLAADVLGNAHTQVRWRDFLENPALVGPMSNTQRRAAFRQSLQHRRVRILGRAADGLFNLLPVKPYDYFTYQNCSASLLGARHVHIDGAGHVFPGTCLGIILGNLRKPQKIPLWQLWAQFNPLNHPLITLLIEKGPVGLYHWARKQGYLPLPGYAHKCHLCYHIRRFWFQQGLHRQYLGPDVCYGFKEKSEKNLTSNPNNT